MEKDRINIHKFKQLMDRDAGRKPEIIEEPEHELGSDQGEEETKMNYVQFKSVVIDEIKRKVMQTPKENEKMKHSVFIATEE